MDTSRLFRAPFAQDATPDPIPSLCRSPVINRPSSHHHLPSQTPPGPLLQVRFRRRPLLSEQPGASQGHEMDGVILGGYCSPSRRNASLGRPRLKVKTGVTTMVSQVLREEPQHQQQQQHHTLTYFQQQRMIEERAVAEEKQQQQQNNNNNNSPSSYDALVRTAASLQAESEERQRPRSRLEARLGLPRRAHTHNNATKTTTSSNRKNPHHHHTSSNCQPRRIKESSSRRPKNDSQSQKSDVLLLGQSAQQESYLLDELKNKQIEHQKDQRELAQAEALKAQLIRQLKAIDAGGGEGGGGGRPSIQQQVQWEDAQEHGGQRNKNVQQWLTSL